MCVCVCVCVCYTLMLQVQAINSAGIGTPSTPVEFTTDGELP